MTKLYIHIGTHKTGSTAIQTALGKKSGELKKEGIIYIPKPSAFKTLKKSRKLNHEVINTCSEYLISKINTHKIGTNIPKTLVISYEGLSGDQYIGYSNSGVVCQSLKNIIESLGVELDVYIVVYLRSQDDFIESLYTQKIHEGGSETFENFLNRFNEKSFNWKLLLDSFSKTFGEDKVIVKRYHKNYLDNGIINNFGKIIDSDTLLEYEGENIRNSGYNRDALEIARLVNPALDDEKKKKLRHLLQKSNAKQPFEKYSYFSKKGRISFLSQYEDSNSAVARDYFENSSELLFPPKTLESKDEYTYENLTIERLAIALMKVNLIEEKKPLIIRILFKIENSILNFISRFPKLKKFIYKIIK